MAIEILDDHEQGEVVRRWLAQYGSALLGGVVLGIGALIGVQQWQNYSVEQRAEGALQFQQLVEAYDSRDLDLAERLGADIKERRTNTPYASLAALREADSALDSGDLDKTAASLQWVVEHGGDAALKDLATLRLARIRLAQGDAQQALSLAGNFAGGAFAALAAEVRGDALADLGRPEEAAAAYREGLQGDGAQFARSDVLRMKLENLGGDADEGSES